MQKDTFELTKNAINKSLIIFKIFLKKVLEFSLHYQIVGFKATFILMLLLNHHFAKKQGRKKDLIRLISFNNFKIIFTLLKKLIAI